MLVVRQGFLTHIGNWNLYRLIGIGYLYNFRIHRLEMHAQLRMCLDECFQGLAKSFYVCRQRESYLHRNIIDGRRRILHTVHIDTHLGIAEGNGLVGVLLLRHSFYLLSLISYLYIILQYLILNTLQCAGLHQRLRIECDAEAFVHLNSQFDGRDRRQTDIAQDGGDAEILVIHDARNHLMQLLLQDV